MNLVDLLPLLAGGFAAGISAGILGIGGGTLLVPMIGTLGYPPIQAVATSSLAIVITATSGSIQNWRMGKLNLRKVLYLGVPSMMTSYLGALIANRIPDYFLLLGFSLLLLINIYLISLRQSLGSKAKNQQHPSSLDSPTVNKFNPRWMLSVIATGGSAGIIAGFFACMSHALNGNVLFAQGICLGIGGLLGVQISTRFLPKLPDKVVSLIFRCFMGLLAGYMLIQAWNKYVYCFKMKKVTTWFVDS